MKTLTEFSGSQIRTAAAAIAGARRSLPAEEKPADAGVAEAAPPAPEGAVAEAAAPAPPAAPVPERAEDSEAVKAVLDDAVARATGASGDRLAMLRAAVEAAGRRADDVRLVRVCSLEEPVGGARVIGGHQYVVDLFPSSMKQVAGSRDEPGRRGGRGGGPRGAGRGGGGGGRGDGPKGGAPGRFSMDSLREDRKNERGGRPRPAGAARPGGGGSSRGSGPGKPPGGGAST